MTDESTPWLDAAMTIREFQERIRDLYFERDSARGTDRAFVWLVEEVGEVAAELRREPRRPDRLAGELGDALAWLATLANLLDVDLEEAAGAYAVGCPKCQLTPCHCPEGGEASSGRLVR